MMNKKNGEIYIHIPFCVKKCDYCDFLSFVTTDDKKNEYINAIKKEIKLSKNKLEGYSISTIFIGGGTPSILSGKNIFDLIETVKENITFSENPEITIECNPGTLTEEKLLWYKKAGINRLSIGLQSANNQELKSIGRIHTYEEFLNSYKFARKVGFNNINIDIISALPGQTLDSYMDTLEKVIKLNTEHISAYSLIVEPETPMKDRVDANPQILPTEEVERGMYYETEKLLKSKGYERYEISNYAKKGYNCQHNLGYWNRTDYFGFGIGAASLVSHTRYSNIRDINRYIETMGKENPKLSEIRIDEENLTKKMEIEEFMFLGLRIMDGISKKKFFNEFGKNYNEIYGKITEKLVEEGLLKVNRDNVKLTSKGIDLSNGVLSEFLLD